MEQVRQAAEAQARRRAPDRQDVKRRRVDAPAEEEEYKELLRYEYEGADALLDGGRGFVVLCGFRREKSATREATAVLGEYLRIVAPGPVPAAALETGQPCAPALGEERPAAAPRPQPTPLLALVKLACKGAVCLRLLGPGSPGEAVERLVRDVEQGKRPQLQCVAPLLRQEGRGVSCATSERAA